MPFFLLRNSSDEIFLKENEEKIEIKINVFIKEIECKIHRGTLEINSPVK